MNTMQAESISEFSKDNTSRGINISVSGNNFAKKQTKKTSPGFLLK